MKKAVNEHFPEAVVVGVIDVAKIELTVNKKDNKLEPADHYSSEIMSTSIRSGKPVVVTVHQARNPQHHSKLWALAAKVAENCEDFGDAEDAVQWVKLHIPSMQQHITMVDGKPAITTKSIAWASMDQLRFERFYDRALYLWSQKIGVDPLTLLAETET